MTWSLNFLERSNNPIPADVHLVVVGHTDVRKLLDANRGPIALVICIQGTITVMDVRLEVGEAVLFDTSKVFSLKTYRNPTPSMYTLVHLQPGWLKDFHLDHEHKAIVPNCSRLGGAPGAMATGGTKTRADVTPSTPKSAPERPPFLEQPASTQDDPVAVDVDSLLGAFKPWEKPEWWNTDNCDVQIEAPPLRVYDRERYLFGPELKTPRGRKFHLVSMRETPQSPYKAAPYVVATHPEQPVGFGVFATERIEFGDPRAAIDYLGVRADKTWHAQDEDYAIEVKDGERTRWEVAEGVPEATVSTCKYIIPDTTGLPAQHGAAQFLNHYDGLASSPNYGLTYDAVLVPLRDIEKGEELLWQYGDTRSRILERRDYLRTSGKSLIKPAKTQPVVESVESTAMDVV